MSLVNGESFQPITYRAKEESDFHKDPKKLIKELENQVLYDCG